MSVPSTELGPPTPSPRKRVCLPPWTQRGEEQHSLVSNSNEGKQGSPPYNSALPMPSHTYNIYKKISKKDYMQDRSKVCVNATALLKINKLHRNSTTASIKTVKKLQTLHFCRQFLLELPGRWSSLGGNLENWSVYAAE